MKIEDEPTVDLMYGLSYQYPTSITTYASCPRCGDPSRGGAFCSTCISNELVRRGTPQEKVDAATDALSRRQAAQRAFEELASAIRKANK